MFPTPRQLTALFFLSCIAAYAHLQADIVAGPMLGHIDMREATIWVQTDASPTPSKGKPMRYDGAIPFRLATPSITPQP